MNDIAFLIWSKSTFGGAERRFARLAYYLNQKNYKVTIFCPAESIIPLEEAGICVNQISVNFITKNNNLKLNILRKIYFLISILKFVKLIKSRNYELIFIAGNPGLISFLITKLAGKKQKISVAMVDPTYKHNKTFIDSFFVNNTLRRVYSVDCLSESVRLDFLPDIRKEDIKKIKIAPCSFTDYSLTKQYTNRDIDIVCIGRLVEGKGHELIEKISNHFENLNVHICGSGPLKLNIANVSMYRSNDPFSVLARSKISLSLQKYNNYPSQVVLESMASGCAIIATDTGETRKFLDESCAILIPYDHTALLNAINLLLNDPYKCRMLGQAARRMVINNHNIKKYADYFIQSVI
jgi:glycosyltransferase involved in cell wall biosynthesis